MQVKVVLPSGEVNVPVEPNSTPGHLKENLKYSIRVPPKQIKLTCEGRELDDIKPLVGEPNNVTDGAVLVAERREGVVEDESIVPKSSPPPAMIRKEEPPKPKKPKKDVVRPTLSEGDVKKDKTLSPGHQGWAAKSAYLEAKSKKRHMAFLKIENSEEKKAYPEHEDFSVALPLGDPQCSPVWTAVVQQLEIGERASFTLSRKVLDFNPESLAPDDYCSTWEVELIRVAEVEDVAEDFQQLLEIENSGSKDRAEDLDAAAVHWRVRRWMPEGTFCIASSRERIAILPGYGLVPIEDQNAPPVSVAVGEGQQEAVELIASRVGPGGKGHLYLKSQALKANRPNGCVIMDVELVALDPCRGPGTPGWRGWQSLISERETGDSWLDEADGRRKQLETFGTLRKSTEDSKGAEAHVAEQVHKYAYNAERRYRRGLKWIDMDKKDDRKLQLEQATLRMRLAKAMSLAHMRFGENPEPAGEAEKAALKEARQLLAEVLKVSEALNNDSVKYECMKMNLQVCIQDEDVAEARKVLSQLQEERPDDEDLKSDNARINRLENELSLKKGAGTVEELQKDLQQAVTAGDKPKVGEILEALLGMFKESKVTYDAVKNCKVGKDVGNAMKMGDPDIAALGRKAVGEIQALAQRAALGI
ncbi:unnamed protein product [Symbiodinium natans]|uniref:Ubiquitin-like domain-containing protein n=1 Tax=Symbiodinium natans TaxID=878477 RepID=A0A812UK75_9DINO|nr:unnamed protein product [Symbiodinium natans]